MKVASIRYLRDYDSRIPEGYNKKTAVLAENGCFIFDYTNSNCWFVEKNNFEVTEDLWTLGVLSEPNQGNAATAASLISLMGSKPKKVTIEF